MSKVPAELLPAAIAAGADLIDDVIALVALSYTPLATPLSCVITASLAPPFALATPA